MLLKMSSKICFYVPKTAKYGLNFRALIIIIVITSFSKHDLVEHIKRSIDEMIVEHIT